MANPITAHFKQPAGVATITLCSGILAAWVAVMVAEDKPSTRELIWLFAPFTALPCALYLLWRLIRPFSGEEARTPERCQICGSPDGTSPVRYVQLTGLVVAMLMRELPLHVCRPCSRSAFLRMTLHTLVLGWWSIFSLFVTPGFLFNNVGFLLRSQLFTRAPRS